MVAVVTKHGTPLDPTTERRTRKLLKSGKAQVYQYRPIFTIRMLEREDGMTHPMEYKSDVGYEHVGISICNEYHEAVSEQRDLLTDETEHHNDQRKYRCARRNRKRYRKPRPLRGVMQEGEFPPSILHRMEVQASLAVRFAEVLPITSFVFEMGMFDTQVLKAIENGDPLPQGEDYQHGERYGIATLREAVFSRDGHTCQCCGRGIKEKAILHVHHIGFWKGGRTNRMGNLMTVCEKCHTAKKHKKSGKLYGLNPKLKPLKGATFMTTIRFRMYEILADQLGKERVHLTYGAATKKARRELGVKKTHANDAYCMGRFHPKHRKKTVYWKKCRRNNRCLEKFYDAVYIDSRDGSKKKGSQIGYNRTKRSVPRRNEQNERCFRQEKIRAGKRVIRKKRYELRPGDLVSYKNKRYTVKGVKNNGQAVALGGVNPSIKNVTLIQHAGGWCYAN